MSHPKVDEVARIMGGIIQVFAGPGDYVSWEEDYGDGLEMRVDGMVNLSKLAEAVLDHLEVGRE